MRTFLIAVAMLGVGAGCGRTHTLTDGRYELSLTEVVRDDCALVNQSGVVSGGTLRTTGNVVRFDYDLFDIQMNGNYASSEERMSLDGSAANVQLTVSANDCLLDLVTLHLEASSASPTQFTGSLAYSLENERKNACVCDLWILYQANLTAATP